MDTPPAAGPVAAVVALKPTEFAKSRLSGVPDPLRRRMAWTMAVDTVRALAAAVDTVLVVGDQPALESSLARHGLAVEVLPESGQSGMNAALRHGDEHLRGRGFRTVLACVGDLPALRPDSVRAVLSASVEHPRSFVADASGIGTTLLVARSVALDPRYQGRSAAAHRSSGAVALGLSVPDARRDVDTDVDLADAYRLGLGPQTAALFAADGRLGAYAVITVAAQPGPVDGTHSAITTGGVRVSVPTVALDPTRRHLRPGQRLHAALDEGQALSVWW